VNKAEGHVARMEEPEPQERWRKMDGRYLYAIVPASGADDYGPVGLQGGKVYTIGNGVLAAVVSDIENKKLRPERRNLAAHQEVLKQLTRGTDLLPMSFGIIAESSRSVERILTKNREDFLEQLERVAGKVEMGLRVAWDVPNIFELMVNTHPELREARDRLLGSNQNPSQEDRIEIGRMFDRILQQDRENHTDHVEEILGEHCTEIKQNKCRNEREVMNLACLMPRDKDQDFEKAVFEAARHFDDNYAFDYNGPWAPHNFVEMELDI